MSKPPASLASRFWPKVHVRGPNDCWLWQASKHPFGYGILWAMPYKRGHINAHVASWYLAYGTWPPAGMCVLHNCPGGDNPSCVNPAHLWLGTLKDNSQDCVKKGRHARTTRPERTARGERHGNSKITDVQWQEALTLYHTGQWSMIALAKEFGLTPNAIRERLRYHQDIPCWGLQRSGRRGKQG